MDRQIESTKKIDSLCCRFERAWLQGSPVSIESMLEELPEHRDELFANLLAIELELRFSSGNIDSQSAFCDRFPDQQAIIAEVWDRIEKEHAEDFALATRRSTDTQRAKATEAEPRIPGFEIKNKIGVGGMGVVYAARQQRLNRDVAIKVISPDCSTEEVERFLHEGQIVAAMNHPNLVKIYDSGEVEGQPYLVFEYVADGNLRSALQLPMKPNQAARLVEIIARALFVVHQRGVVHRDLKPANILLESVEASEISAEHIVKLDAMSDFNLNGQTFIPKIADFGLSFRRTSSSRQIGTIGTPAYMAPEQIDALKEDVGPAVDVHALGVLLFELLTGRRPYTGDTVGEIMDQIKFATPPNVLDFQPKVPKELAALCARCLAKTPISRPSSCLEVAEALRPYSQSKPKRLPGRILLLLMLGFAALFGLGIAIQTSIGTVEITSSDPNIEIEILRSDQPVKQLQVGIEETSVRLWAGEYVVRLNGANAERFAIENDVIQLLRGETEVVKIHRRPQVAPPENASRRLARFVFDTAGAVTTSKSKDQAIRTLAELPEKYELHAVRLGRRFNFTNEDLKAFAGVSSIREVSLGAQRNITTDGLRHLAHLTDLRAADLFGTMVDDHGLKLLAQHRGLEYLSIVGTEITGRSIAELSALRNLTSIYVRGIQISTEQGVTWLRALKNLRSARVRGKVLALGWMAFEGSPIQHLTIEMRRDFSEQEFDQLSQLLPNLETLQFSQATIPRGFLDQLAGMNRLKKLVLYNTGSPLAEVQRLRSKLPDCQIVYDWPKNATTQIVAQGGIVRTDDDRTIRKLRQILGRKFSITSIEFPEQFDRNRIPVDLGCLVEHPELRDLIIRDRNLSPATGPTLSAPQKLHRLSLRGSDASDELIDFLLHCEQLRTLDVAETELTTDGFQQLSNHGEVRDLTVSGSQLDPSTCLALGQMQRLRALRVVGLKDAQTPPIGSLSELTELEILDSPNLTDIGLALLLDLPRLKILTIRGAGLTDASREKLKAWNRVDRELTIHASGLSDEAAFNQP